MSKYSFDLKLKVVQDYKQGLGGYNFLAQKYNSNDMFQVRNWIKAYQSFGLDGLRRKRQSVSYSTEFKLNAVNLYLTTEKTYRELASELQMNNPALLKSWVISYRKQGELTFAPKLVEDLEKSQ
ncbi:helix-turn-helix domain-containing protein [Lactovum miscens]|uniref:Transposase-like protein n=1 Tax=Lactovum miscens TaxID=190387 RepID=A0A841C8D9_9LACT|nr:helix-turn-helix domain-containing protein [Lactovum miscens]MBB5888755.1 transposase-like protein [Lactovum miscens]